MGPSDERAGVGNSEVEPTPVVFITRWALVEAVRWRTRGWSGDRFGTLPLHARPPRACDYACPFGRSRGLASPTSPSTPSASSRRPRHELLRSGQVRGRGRQALEQAAADARAAEERAEEARRAVGETERKVRERGGAG